MRFAGPKTLVVATILGLSVGLPQIFLATFSVFLNPLINEFGWSRSQVSVLFSVVTVSIAVAAPIFALLIRKFGLRPLLVSSVVFLTASLMFMSWSVSNYTTFLIWVIVIGLLGTGTTTFAYLSVFPSWFSKRLGIALGIAAMGIGLGQMLFPVLSQHFIAEYGWRVAYQLLAVISLVIALPIALFVIRQKTNESDQEDQSTISGAEKFVEPIQIENGSAHYYTNAKFWYLGLGFFIIPMIAAGCTLHAMPIFMEKGISEGEAARIYALGGLSIMVARVVAGFLLDWIGAKAVAVMACIAAMIAPLVLSSAVPAYAVIVGPLLYGLALGIEGDLMPFGIRNAFGTASVPVLYGLFFGVFNCGVVVGPLIMGITYDRTGSYDGALIALSVTALFAIPLFLKGLDSNSNVVNA